MLWGRLRTRSVQADSPRSAPGKPFHDDLDTCYCGPMKPSARAMNRHPLPVIAAILAGCLLLETPPPTPACADGECPDGFECEDDERTCLTSCDADDECVDPLICTIYGDCEEQCKDADCPGGFACKPDGRNECQTECFADYYCRSGYVCCGSLDFYNGVCDATYECFEA